MLSTVSAIRSGVNSWASHASTTRNARASLIDAAGGARRPGSDAGHSPAPTDGSGTGHDRTWSSPPTGVPGRGRRTSRTTTCLAGRTGGTTWRCGASTSSPTTASAPRRRTARRRRSLRGWRRPTTPSRQPRHDERPASIRTTRPPGRVGVPRRGSGPTPGRRGTTGSSGSTERPPSTTLRARRCGAGCGPGRAPMATARLAR